MSDPILIVAALNGTRSTEECPKLPLKPQDLAAEAKRSVEAGAGMVHVHARKADGAASFDFVIDEIVTSVRGRSAEPVSTAAIASTTSRYSWSATSPKMVCLKFSHVVGATVMKNWEPFVLGPAFAMASR